MKLRVEVMHAFEIEVDDRFELDAAYESGNRVHDAIINRVTDYTDGRYSFSYEMSLNGSAMMAEYVAELAQEAVADRIAKRYPGARRKSYEIRKRLGPVRAWQESRLSDGSENPVVTITPITPRDP